MDVKSKWGRRQPNITKVMRSTPPGARRINLDAGLMEEDAAMLACDWGQFPACVATFCQSQTASNGGRQASEAVFDLASV